MRSVSGPRNGTVRTQPPMTVPPINPACELLRPNSGASTGSNVTKLENDVMLSTSTQHTVAVSRAADIRRTGSCFGPRGSARRMDEGVLAEHALFSARMRDEPHARRVRGQGL